MKETSVMVEENIPFKVIEYADNTYRIETPHMHYHFQDGLFEDNVKRENLFNTMQNIADICEIKFNKQAMFTLPEKFDW